MKKNIIVLLSIITFILVTACSSSEKASPYSIVVNGESIDPQKFFETNDLKKGEYIGERIIITGKVSEINGPIGYSSVADMDSSVELVVTNSIFPYIVIDTSGLEDTIKNWNVDDIVRVEGNISYFFSNSLFLTRSEQTNDGIVISNETTGDNIVNFAKVVEVFNDIDSKTYQAIDQILQSDEDNYWEYNDAYKTKVYFNQGTFKVSMTISGSTISNKGSYKIKDKAIIITYDNGEKAIMRYTYENGELTYLGMLEEYVQ